MSDAALDRLFDRYVERHVARGERLPLADLCVESPELLGALRRRVEAYHLLDETLLAGPATAEAPRAPAGGPLPSFEGLQTIELIGRGGMGEVYKCRDEALGRLVAVKVLRGDGPLAAYADFLREARAMALFRDHRIVQIHELRADATPPVIVMEHVEGFELGRLAPSLEVRQRARILLDVCEAVGRAHEMGLQHRDLKPQNILLDGTLTPKVVDFGLSSGDPAAGHLVGTPPYLAPEQLDPARPIDARADVHALGVILYELLCGKRPWEPEDARPGGRGSPALPIEIDPSVPEPLQAIALKAMEDDPEDRYRTALDMARDLRRYLDGRRVTARPKVYASALARRIEPHVEEIREWRRLELIYPHEAARLDEAYGRLRAREDDWIVESRVLSYSQIALYLGAFLALCGGLLYFSAHRLFDAGRGALEPLVVLGAPVAALAIAAHLLYRREHRAVAVAFNLASVLLLPLFLVIVLHDAGLFAAAPDAEHQLFGADVVSNRQLQVATLLGLAWSAWLALRTKTIGLASAATLLMTVFALAVLTDLGLDEWLEEGRWDLLALHLAPLAALEASLALALERGGRTASARPLYVGAAVVWIAALELLALDGRAFHYLGLSLAGFQPEEPTSPLLLDTVGAMTLNGLVIHACGWLAERRGTEAMRWAGWLMIVVSPFAILEPAAWLVQTGEYSRRYDWLYLALALAITLASHHRQRKSFYLAGLVNTGAALFLITSHEEWFDEPSWAVTVIGVALAVLACGYALHLRERSARRISG